MSLLQIRNWVKISKSQQCLFCEIFVHLLCRLTDLLDSLCLTWLIFFPCRCFITIYPETVEGGQTNESQLLKPFFVKQPFLVAGSSTLPKTSPKPFHTVTDRKGSIVLSEPLQR